MSATKSNIIYQYNLHPWEVLKLYPWTVYTPGSLCGNSHACSMKNFSLRNGPYLSTASTLIKESYKMYLLHHGGFTDLNTWTLTKTTSGRKYISESPWRLGNSKPLFRCVSFGIWESPLINSVVHTTFTLSSLGIVSCLVPGFLGDHVHPECMMKGDKSITITSECEFNPCRKVENCTHKVTVPLNSKNSPRNQLQKHFLEF